MVENLLKKFIVACKVGMKQINKFRILFRRRQSLDKDRIISILTDVNARLIESTRYNMDFAEYEIKDCVSLIDVVIKEMNENSTNTI